MYCYMNEEVMHGNGEFEGINRRNGIYYCKGLPSSSFSIMFPESRSLWANTTGELRRLVSSCSIMMSCINKQDSVSKYIYVYD